jgi:DNA primase
LKNTLYDDFVDRVRTESDIISVISEYVPLKKRGKNFWGCCPFHNEKTPSFSVAPDKGFFYCFGCQAGGNVFNFLMKIENISFFEAVKKMAQKLNIPLPDQEKSEFELSREREMAQLYRVNEMARDFFHNCLTKTNYGKEALAYLTSRGLTKAGIDTFKIGFAPPGWDKLSLAFQERGFDQDLLLKAGLVSSRPTGEGSYDRFRNRIIFPICDARGRVIGFGGRVMDDSQPKYLNSPETILFNKRQTLFAFDQACKSIRDSGQAIVVEGYMDAITAHEAGAKNVVASLGTAFTPEQGRLLLRQATEVVFAYDSDAAGQNATLRALEVVRTLGIAIRIATVPESKDPDEFIRKNGIQQFLNFIQRAPGLLDYQIQQALKDTDYSRLEGKVAVVAKALPALIQSNNAVEIDGHITRLSQILSIDESAIRSEFNKYAINNKKDKIVKTGKNGYNTTSVPVSRRTVQKNATAEQHLIRLMCEDPALISYVQVQLSADDFQDESRREIINSLFHAYNSGNQLAPATLANSLSDNASIELSHIMLIDGQTSDVTRMVDDYIKAIRLTRLKILYEQHRLRADELERLGDSRFQEELAESKRINDEIKLLLQS